MNSRPRWNNHRATWLPCTLHAHEFLTHLGHLRYELISDAAEAGCPVDPDLVEVHPAWLSPFADSRCRGSNEQWKPARCPRRWQVLSATASLLSSLSLQAVSINDPELLATVAAFQVLLNLLIVLSLCFHYLFTGLSLCSLSVLSSGTDHRSQTGWMVDRDFPICSPRPALSQCLESLFRFVASKMWCITVVCC